ncbi:6883_t:CDS:2 [Diversispora eburnea]|uniref:6883_t:CDS:1 n=1 Tax=Diversispora eburnea TaxID=1213867 RepID=A0A9N8V405_9GLOM|nr:6883_t:CDS:2 [Diversispora eburnea]
MLSIGFTINLAYTVIYKVPWPQPQCGIVGAYVVTLSALNFFLVTFVAASTWLRVCKEVYLETGIYDYRLWIITLSLSALIDLISINDFGQHKYWCAAYPKSITLPLIMFCLITICLITIIFCYLQVLLKIKNLDDSLLTSSYMSPQRVYIEKRALRKLISYIFTFMLQFIPLIAYHLGSLFKVEHVFLYVLATTSNFIQYLINEGIFSADNSSIISSFQRNSSAPESVSKISKNIKKSKLSCVKEERDEVIEKINDDEIKEISIYEFFKNDNQYHNNIEDHLK